MAQQPTAEEIAEAFDRIEGIRAKPSWVDTDAAIVEVMSESSIGAFFGTLRSLGCENYDTTRDSNDDSDCVMFGWVRPEQ